MPESTHDSHMFTRVIYLKQTQMHCSVSLEHTDRCKTFSQMSETFLGIAYNKIQLWELKYLIR